MASNNAFKNLTNLENSKTEEKCKCKKDGKSMCKKNCTSNVVPTRSDPINATSKRTVSGVASKTTSVKSSLSQPRSKIGPTLPKTDVKENKLKVATSKKITPIKVKPVSTKATSGLAVKSTLRKRKLSNVDDNKENVQKKPATIRQFDRGSQARDSKKGCVTAPISLAGSSTSKITLRKPETITKEEDIFIDGEKHPIKFVRENLLINTPIKEKQNIRFRDVSPIKPDSNSLRFINCEGTIICDYLTQFPARKEKFLAKREEHYRLQKQAANKQPYLCDIYNSEYLNDNISYLMETEDGFRIENKEFLKKHNPREELRLIIVNWLFKVQREYGEETSTVLMTIYLFDNVLSAMPVPDTMYQIVIITLLWILNKLHRVRDHNIRVKHLLEMCNKSYFEDQFYAMELKLLKFFNFTLNVQEPLSYLYCYNHKITLKPSVLVLAKYMIEAFALSKYFSTIKPSELATAVLVLTYEIEDPKSLKTLSSHLLHDINSLAAIKTCLVQHMKSMKKEIYQHSQVNKKYLTTIDKNYPDFFIKLLYVK